MQGHSGSVIVISNSDKFSLYLDGLMISNVYFRNISDFNNMYTNFPLTAAKVIVFESGVVDIKTIQKFSAVINEDLAQVGELIFLVGEGFKEYFEVSFANFPSTKFLSPEITYKKLEEVLTESKSYELKNKMEVVDVIQRKKKEAKKSKEVGKFQTRVTIDRLSPNTKISREEELLNRDVIIEEEKKGRSSNLKSQFNYTQEEGRGKYRNNTVLLYDTGLNVYDLIKSDYSEGRRLLFIDHSDSMLLSYLVENDSNLPPSLTLGDLYSEGTNAEFIKEFFTQQDICIIRNSYVMKGTLTHEEITNLIRFIVGRYSGRFDGVYVVTDDLKIVWASTIRYIILPPSIDNLMKMVNYAERGEEGSVSNSYIKLDNTQVPPNLKIDERVTKTYLNNLELDKVKVVNGVIDKNNLSKTYLFDILNIELGVDTNSIDQENQIKKGGR